MYNLTHNDHIDTTELEHLKKYNQITYKKRIVDLLTHKMKNYQCDTQTCWLTLPFFRKLSTPDKTKRLHKYTFKPRGPNDTNDWLNTLNINDVFVQYENYYKDFKFMGANPRDFDELPSSEIPNMNFEQLMASGKFRLGFIFNLDKHNESGSHWVALFADILKGQIYYIDSVGESPKQEFKALMNRIKKFCLTTARKNYCMKNGMDGGNLDNLDMQYSKTQHQHGNSECGVYAISFILRLLDGETFDDLTKTHVGDHEIQTCRLSYFRTNKTK